MKLFGILLSAILLSSFGAQAATYYVRPAGDDTNNGRKHESAFRTISKSIQSASSGDKIFVEKGLYKEGKTIIIPKNVTLKGGFSFKNGKEANPFKNATVIDGEYSYSCVTNNGTLEGFIIQHGEQNETNLPTGSAGGGVYNTGVVNNCIIRNNNSRTSGGGVYNEDEAFAEVNNSIIYNNRTGLLGAGIYNGTENLVSTCAIYNNTTNFEGGGLYNAGYVSCCSVAGNQCGNAGGIFNSGSASNSIFWNNEFFDLIEESSSYGFTATGYCCYKEAQGPDYTGNIAEAPLFSCTTGDPSVWDLHLQSNSPCINAGASVFAEETEDMEGLERPNGALDMGAYEYQNSVKRPIFSSDKAYIFKGETIHFKDLSDGNPSSWTWDLDGDGEFDSSAQNPSFTYTEPGAYTVTLKLPNTSREISKPNYIHVGQRYYVKSEGSDSSDGTNWNEAFKTVEKAVESLSEGDQIWIAGGTYSITKALIIPHKASLYGGFTGTENQLNQRNTESSKTIINGQNITRCITNYGTISDLSITEGNCSDDYAGGVLNYGTVNKCSIYNNKSTYSAGGAYNRYKATINRCRIYGNESQDGGGLMNTGTATNCLIYLNSAILKGGGVNNNYGYLINCTVYKNEAPSVGGIDNLGDVSNTISYDNTNGNIIQRYTFEKEFITYCCFNEGTEGTGNIDENPLFVNVTGDMETWDFHLQKTSPCIDSGTATNAPSDDFDGYTRPENNIYDIGAYEYHELPTSVNQLTWSLCK